MIITATKESEPWFGMYNRHLHHPLFISLFSLLAAFFVFPVAAQNQVPGTQVTSPIVPNDLRDDYPTHVDIYGKGGYRSVATKAERDNIKESHRTLNMLVHVSDAACDSTFRLHGGLTNDHWVYWLPNSNMATYNMTKGSPPEDYKVMYPFVQVRTPIYFRFPFENDLYYMRIQCYNDRGTVPYLIVDQKSEYFSLDVAEPCICSWEARAIN